TDIMIRSVVLQVCFLAITFQGAALGDVTLAANQILYQFFTISAYALDGFAFASEALVGAAIGARNRTALRRAAVLGSVWGLTVVGLLSLVYWVFGAQLIGLMTTADDVVATALIYLPWCVLAPAIGLPAFMLDGVFIGATRTRDLRNMMILSALIYFACLFPLVAAFGNHGLWGALVVFFIARAVTLGWKYPALERDAEG
ncbi:MAG: MATE family efflux transporter, partial [Pseudomonadota bacterium]